MTRPVKFTAYIRFAIGGFYFLNYLVSVIFMYFTEQAHPADWIIDLIGGMMALVYLAYCIRQGTMELKNLNCELPYPRILAILIELFSVGSFVFVLTQLEQIDLTILPDLILMTGMGYLFTQNLRIAFGNS